MYGDAFEPDPEKRLDEWMRAGDYAQALSWLREWAEREPWNGEVLLRMAVVHWLAGEPAQTLRALDAFLLLEPENAEAIARRAQALLMLGKHADAEAALARAEALDPLTPGVLLNRALILEGQNDFDGALTALTGYLEQVPRDHLALARRSQYLRRLGRYPEALADAQASVSMKPDDPETHLMAALAHVALEDGDAALFSCERCLQLQPLFLPALRLKVDLMADLGRLSEAEAALEAVRAADPDSPHTALLQARMATEQGDFPAALAAMHRYLRDSADEPYGHYRRGIVYFRMGDYPRALADFQTYARLAPQAVEAYEEQYLCYLEMDRLDEAVTAASIAARLQPTLARPRFNLGFAELLRGHTEAALAAFTGALECAPADEELLVRLHMALTLHARGEVRLAWLRDAAARHGDASPMLNGLLAEALIDGGQTQAGLALARELLKTDPRRPYTYLLNIKALCLLNQYPEALSVADSGVNLLPHDGRLRLGRALVLRDIGLPDEALQDLEQAEALQPDDPEVPRQKALVYGSMGDAARAIHWLRAALELAGNHADTYFWLGYFQVHRGQFREAARAADALLALAPNTAEG
ncbi:MAG TPA: tetratricopeptide repeat protein, partial [Armatimonadota bacterium]|nr:tetratricopeptide repeat protein [Armatimonadota bacterium]